MPEYSYTFNSERTFGVEIECVIKRRHTRREILESLQAQGISVIDELNYSHTINNTQNWIMKVDGSIMDDNGTFLRGSGTGLELVTRILHGHEGLLELAKGVEVLNQFCKVNRSCGLHVHHGAPDLTGKAFKAVYELYRKNTTTIDLLLTPSRRSALNPTYCRPITMTAMPTTDIPARVASQIASHDSRAAVNFCSYSMRGTIEFRQHHGTLDCTKIIAWLVFTQAVLEFSMNSTGRRILDYSTMTSFTPINALAWRVGLPRSGDTFEAKQYYRLRKAYNLFSRQHTEAMEAERVRRATLNGERPAIPTTQSMVQEVEG